MKQPSKSGVPIVRSVERAIALLRAFSADQPRQTLTQLSIAASLDKNTTRRLLHTLETGGLVDHGEGLYGLSSGLLELFAGVEINRDLREISSPILKSIATETSATAFLWTYSEGFAVCIDRVRPPRPKVEVTWSPVGSRTTLNSGGGPLALLGHVFPQERDVALNQLMISRTPLSIVDRDRLEEKVEVIAKAGYAVAEGDFLSGLSGIGVPIFDRSRTLQGALSISSLSDHIDALTKSGVIEDLKAHARSIGLRL